MWREVSPTPQTPKDGLGLGEEASPGQAQGCGCPCLPSPTPGNAYESSQGEWNHPEKEFLFLLSGLFTNEPLLPIASLVPSSGQPFSRYLRPWWHWQHGYLKTDPATSYSLTPLTVPRGTDRLASGKRLNQITLRLPS